MKTNEFTKFKIQYLKRFRKYYKESINKMQRDELKRSIFDNPNLTGNQKNKFWELVKE